MFSNGGVSRSGLVLPFLSFLGLSRFFWDFPDLLGDGPGIFPICPFPLSLGLLRAPTRSQSRKGPRHNLDLSRKKWETPGFGNPPGLASLKYCTGNFLRFRLRIGNGPNTVSGSTVSNTKLSECFGAHGVPGSELSVSL